MTIRAATLCGLLMLAGIAHAAEGPAPLTSTAAFNKAYAASFYQFDACGDGLAGRIYRSALLAKLKQCPFSPDAVKSFQTWSAAQRQMSGKLMAKLIDDNGGLPVRLDGMSRTCHEQIDSPEYRAVRGALDDFAAGKSGPDAVVAQPCDAAEIAP